MKNEELETRRLPVYFVLDCSASMSGSQILALKEGVKIVINDLNREPWAHGMVWISIITFSNTVEQIIPLSEITKFPEFNLIASGLTGLDTVLKFLSECIDRDVRKRTSEHRGDYKPLIYLFTNGQSASNIDKPAFEYLLNNKIHSLNTIIVFNENILRNISDHCTIVLANSGIQEYTSQSIRHEIIPKSWGVSLRKEEEYVTFKGTRLSQIIEQPDLPDYAKFVDKKDG